MSAEIQSVRIFIAYSSKDLEFQKELKNHLEPLIRNKRIVVMDNYAINPGDNWDEKIGQMLEQSDIVLLLLSADALASPHFFREARIAIEQRRQGRTDIIPVKLRSCDLEEEPLLQELNLLEVLPEKDLPVVKWQHRDDAYVSILKGLKKVLLIREEALSIKRKDEKEHKEDEEAARKKREMQDHSTFHLAKTRKDFEDYLKRGFTLYAKRAEEQIAILQKQEQEGVDNNEKEERKTKRREAAHRSNSTSKNLVDISGMMQKLTPKVKSDPFADLMIPIKGGTFEMGSNERDFEKPIHRVTVKDFYLCKYPVTQAQWKAIMGDNPSNFKGDDLPVEQVSWDDAQEFIKKLNEKTGKKYRLPSEAEWEYAARGGQNSLSIGEGRGGAGYEYAGSNDLKEVGWYWENSGDKPLSGSWNVESLTKNNCRTHPVGQKKANELGLFDMSGNVWEWCADHWHENYKGAPDDGSAWASGGDSSLRVVRGGSWYYYPYDCRVAFRFWDLSALRLSLIGFRLAR